MKNAVHVQDFGEYGVEDDGEDGGNGSSEGVHKVKARFLLFDLWGVLVIDRQVNNISYFHKPTASPNQQRRATLYHHHKILSPTGVWKRFLRIIDFI